MTKQNRIGLIVAATVLVTVVASSAMAAPKDFCRTYAKTAVSHSNLAQSQNLGCTGFRWHNWYDGHYEWCRSTSKASATSETFARKRAIFGAQC